MVHRLSTRLIALLCGVAALSTVLTLALQDRSLRKDLERAARERLERAGTSAERLVQIHLEAMSSRYRAISGTPQFRANLEIGDGPTLAHYADGLARRQSAARVFFLDDRGDVAAEAGEPSIPRPDLRGDAAALVAHDGRAWAAASVSLETGSHAVGRLLAVEPLGADVLREWSDLCGARVFVTGRAARSQSGLEAAVRRFGELELRVAASLDAERGALAHSRHNLLIAGSIALAAAFLASVFAGREVVRPVLELRRAAEKVGRGDLTVQIEARRNDEIGDVARAFAAMTEALRGMVGRVASAADRVESTAGDTTRICGSLTEATASQVRGIDQAKASMNEINVEVGALAESTADSADALHAAAEGSTTSLRRLASTGDALNHDAQSLAEQVGQVASSVAGMLDHARRIGTDADALSRAADETSQRMEDMAGSTRRVSEDARQADDLSRAVVASAERARERVHDTIRGMDGIRRATDTARQVVHSLGDRVAEIGKIVSVIDKVTAETNMLALNASIIAARSGESGRAFSVVADEMKALADHVLASTKEIEGLVHAIEREGDAATEAIERGAESVSAGVTLAGEAGDALEDITRAARESGERTIGIVAAMDEQAFAAEGVVQLMHGVRSDVARIRAAVEEQERGNRIAATSSDAVGELARSLQTATGEQAQGTARIGEDVEIVRSGVEKITRALAAQSGACLRAARFLEVAHGHTTSNREAAEGVERAMQDLRQQAELLRSDVHRFSI